MQGLKKMVDERRRQEALVLPAAAFAARYSQLDPDQRMEVTAKTAAFYRSGTNEAPPQITEIAIGSGRRPTADD
ncbi:hypothetical protein IVB45_25275 [Bradyrhizobium sp. 4]|uniref:hypothetical protein n=1 Tax=unclassified Bradyrhizobium TaxID=2631580 RepID=UPI001FFA96A2|nr:MULTISPECIES: hypothetical protein [unclassified Bradyrhizobium]MCK1403210.1 hypothetical protein [Bradyrhizobium sp. 39]MCK1748806.1 hypothetical protein [Bradyrhizobium sp. 135]UPJ33247.1 hypothetical protein IVB45_25275 [Bradyrhizobium sp. 4]